VWRSTKNLGVAVYPGKYNIIIVATYSPPGNDMDDYVMNVVTINDRKDDSLNSWGIKNKELVFNYNNIINKYNNKYINYL